MINMIEIWEMWGPPSKLSFTLRKPILKITAIWQTRILLLLAIAIKINGQHDRLYVTATVFKHVLFRRKWLQIKGPKARQENINLTITPGWMVVAILPCCRAIFAEFSPAHVHCVTEIEIHWTTYRVWNDWLSIPCASVRIPEILSCLLQTAAPFDWFP